VTFYLILNSHTEISVKVRNSIPQTDSMLNACGIDCSNVTDDFICDKQMTMFE